MFDTPEKWREAGFDLWPQVLLTTDP